MRRSDTASRRNNSRSGPIRRSDEKLLGGVQVDGDDPMAGEPALKNTPTNLQRILKNIPSMVSVISVAGDVTYANERLISFVGHELHEIVGQHWLDVFRPEDLPRVAQEWQEGSVRGEAFSFSFRRKRPDGQYRWFEIRFQPGLDRAGGLMCWYALVDDITERRHTEDALRKSESELQTLIEAIPALVWQGDSRGEWVYMNKRLKSYIGTTIEEVCARPWCDLSHPEDREASLKEWTAAVDGQRPYDGTYRYRRADGVFRRVRVIGEPFRDGSGKITRWYGLYIDVEDAKGMEEALQSSQLRLVRASQLAAIAELSASIAHEVNQPLAAVTANAEACVRWVSAEPPNLSRAAIAAERIRRDATAAAEVVGRIRSLFKQEAPTIVPLHIDHVITEVLRLLRNDSRRQTMTISTDFAESLPTVAADRLQMQQIVMNLVLNAIEAMEEMPVTNRKMAVTAHLQTDGYVTVEIRDQGRGLADPTRIFEPFFTTKERGMGIGLSLCRSIVQAHGGQLSAANNTDGPGATFRFSIPARHC